MNKKDNTRSGAAKEASELHNGHRERLREKARRVSFEKLPAHEALELLLFCAVRREDTNHLAHKLIDTFGSMTAVMNASEEELLRVEGVGKHVASVLCAFGRAARAYRGLVDEGSMRICTRRDAVDFAENLFNDEIQPQTWLVLMGYEGSVLYCGRIFAGAVWLTENTRTFITEQALMFQAHCAVLLARRGLDMRGISPVDRMMIHDLAQELARIGLSVLDYIVVTPRRTISLRRDVEMGRSPFDTAEFGRTVREIWMSDPGEVWEADEDIDAEISSNITITDGGE